MKNKTVMRTFEILDLIAKNPQGLALTEIVAMLDIPKSTIHDILQGLMATNGVYYKDERLKTYAIGPSIFALGGAYSRTSNLITVSKPYIEHCCAQLEQPMLLSKLVRNQIVHVYKEEPGNVFLKTPSLGVVPEGVYTTAGKVLITYSDLDREAIELIYGIKDEAFFAELLQIKEQGYGIGVGSDGRHTVAVAAPIFNLENRIGGVITTVGIHIPDMIHKKEIQMVTKAAKDISLGLGYKGKIKDIW